MKQKKKKYGMVATSPFGKNKPIYYNTKTERDKMIKYYKRKGVKYYKKN